MMKKTGTREMRRGETSLREKKKVTGKIFKKESETEGVEYDV